MESVHLSVGHGRRCEKLPWISREHTDVNTWTTGYVESVHILVSVRPSIFKKNDRQDVGMTRAEMPTDNENKLSIR